MVRVFGLIVALAALLAPAQAALLTYNFTNTANGVLGPEAGPLTSSNQFTGGGTVGATEWTTGTLGSGVTRTSTFSLTAGAEAIDLNQIEVRAKRNQTGSNNAARFVVYYNVGLTSTGASGQEAINSTTNTTYGSPNAADLGFRLLAGQTIHFTVAASRLSTSSGTPTISYDFVTLTGAAVPEPGSMAVFGLLGAGIAARRMRRRA
jgi:hypothetical protein